MEVTVCCPVFPTEDKQLVEIALANLFPIQESEEQQTKTYIELKALWNNQSSLSSIRQRIHELRIIDVVRKRLVSNWDDLNTMTRLCFEKQAACVDKLRVVDDAQETPPLGFIEIAIRFQSISKFENFLNWFTPRTSSGQMADC